MNAKQFLQTGGTILVIIGLLGFFGILGPTSEDSIFGTTWWFDNTENWAHMVAGLIYIILGFGFEGSWQKPVTILIGLGLIALGLYSFFVPNATLSGATLQNPADSAFHIVIGLWALLAGLLGKTEQTMMNEMG